MNTENLSTLKIHKLTQEQYDRELAAGRIENNALYLTPDNNEDVITVDTENSNIGTPNGINADTLGGNTLQQIMLAMYPVGAIYMSANAVSPADLFGGTWERIQDTFLLAAGDSYAAGATGGEAEHTLTVDEMPSHTHQIKTNNDDFNNTPSGSNYGTTRDGTTNWYDADWYTQSEGGSQAHNNMPPYLAVYMWRRVS